MILMEILRKKHHVYHWLFFLTAAVIPIIVLALATGPASISVAETFTLLWGGLLSVLSKLPAVFPGLSTSLGNKGAGILNSFPDTYSAIVFQVRLPRIILGWLVGMSLAVTGGCFQGLFKNPMADPYIIGVSSGASLGAALAIVLGLKLFLFGGNWAVIICAFVGALLTVYIVYNIARVGGRIPVTTLLLAGVALASFLTSMVSLLVILGSENMHGIVFWIMGGLAGSNWSLVIMMLPFSLLGTLVILAHARSLNGILLGEESAQHLGIDVEKTKKRLFTASSLVVAAAVSVSGVIGFVGLIVPHAVRLLVGPNHKVLLPASAIAGGLFLVGCDALSRIVMAPAEIPVGIITAAAGAPFFIFLLRRGKREFM
jgi:iron complex transport system permease protein